jgi:hypothetical protein
VSGPKLRGQITGITTIAAGTKAHGVGRVEMKIKRLLD